MAPQAFGMTVFAALLGLCLCAPQAGTLSRWIREPFIAPPAVIDVGVSPGYRRAANNLQTSLNQSADPCDDFFEFSCGRWVANNPIPADLTSYGHFSELREKVLREMNSEFVRGLCNETFSTL